MAQEEVPRRRGVGKRIALVMVVLLCVAAIITAAWALSPVNNNGPTDDNGKDDVMTDDEPRGQSLENTVLNVTDLPSSWRLASPYASFYQGYWPGNYSAVGGRGFNDTVTSDVELYLISMVFVYNTTEEAGEAMDEIKDRSIDLWGNRSWDQIGTASVMGDYNYSGYLLGKVMFFQQDHFVCNMLYYAYTHESGDVTEEMMLAMADLQLKKLL